MFNKDSFLDSVHAGLPDSLGETRKLEWVRDLSGGDINRAALIRSGSTNWFLKYHRNAPAGMFAAEALALTEIADQGCIRVPLPIAHGCDGSVSWLVLEHLELTSNGPASLLGEQLAALHDVNFKQHGWTRDNFIGSTPQCNTPCGDWMTFWRDYRLQPQLEMAKEAGHKGVLQRKGDRLLDNLGQIMGDHQPDASLLHGDLWAGNKAFTTDGQAVIFDPASYYGDRETDIAMTELFGGFGQSFYSAYREHSPLPDGYRLRRELYNLYHMLNHLNLFGSGYLSRCENIIDKLIAQVR